MKWDKPTGSIQQTKDGRYLVMRANSQHWVAYDWNVYDNPKELGVLTMPDVDPKQAVKRIRAVCEAHESALYARRTA